MMTKPEKIDLSALKGKPTYEGSVQDLFSLSLNGKDYFICRTSESGSVFDVGTIFTIPRSGVLRTAVRHYIYSALESSDTWKAIGPEDVRACYKRDDIVNDLTGGGLLDELRRTGAPTHHAGMVDAGTGEVTSGKMPESPSSLVLIEKFPVYRPGRFSLWGRYGWDYNEYFRADKKVIGLEHVFRLGAPGGSSLFSRLATAKKDGPEAVKKFISSVGLSEEPRPWGMFDNMIYDCTTKYEPSDRSLSWQETLNVSGVSGDQFARVVKTLVLCTVYVAKFFREQGLTLWDIKWECAVDGERVVVVDTIDPDSIRVTGRFELDGRDFYVHFNKQAVRDYYKLCHADWYASINKAKDLAKSDAKGRDFMEVYREKVEAGEFPPIPELDPEFGAIQSGKYAAMIEPLIGKGGARDAMTEAKDLMNREIEYYKKAGKLDEFLEMNAG